MEKANSCGVSNNNCSPIGSGSQGYGMCPTMGSEIKVVIEFNRLVREIAFDLASNRLAQRDLVVIPDSLLELCQELVDGQGLFG